MRKNLLALCLVMLTGCSFSEFFMGNKVTSTDPMTGEKTVTYEPAPVDDWIPLLTTLVPGLGIVAGASIRIARKANRTKNGLMDINKEAIENADWTKINSAKSFKKLLHTAKENHNDFGLLKDEYYKWKDKRV